MIKRFAGCKSRNNEISITPPADKTHLVNRLYIYLDDVQIYTLKKKKEKKQINKIKIKLHSLFYTAAQKINYILLLFLSSLRTMAVDN